MDIANLPPALKPIIPYLKQSQQLEKHDLLMAYYCRVHAIQMAMDIKQKLGAAGSFLSIPIVKILDQGDSDKAKLGSRLDEEDEAKYVEAFAMKAFSFADTQDRAGKANKATSTTFYSAFLFFNVLEQMVEVSEEVKLKKKYASWRSVDINTAIKNGVAPSPPPSIDQGEENTNGGETEEDAQLKQLEIELNLAKSALQEDSNNSMSSSTIITSGVSEGGMSSSLSFPSFPSIPNNTTSQSPSFPSFPSTPSPTNSDNAPSFPKFPSSNSQDNKPSFPSFPSTPSPTNSDSATPSFPKFPSNNSQDNKPSFPSFPSSNNNNNTPSFPSFPSTNQKKPVFDSDDEGEQQQNSTSFPKFPSTSQNNEYSQSPPPYEFKQPSPPQQHKQSSQQNHHDSEDLIKYQQQVTQQNLTIQKQKHQNQMLQDEVEQKQSQIQHQQQQLQQQQQQIQQLQQQIQQQQRQLMSGGGGGSGGSGGNGFSINLNYTPSDSDKANAEKYSKWVISSLQFDDVPTAIKNGKLSLKYLTGVDYN
ncbi:hypothetical protein RB653_009842 [Dictyostelium firmibasis]|uniref:Vacuolar protein sorting-associated protein VTA1 homolog n=1 Tax=Dictyostelium firmibasis TaxID=79012 RepID=A0AAN7TKN0_9MYCE